MPVDNSPRPRKAPGEDVLEERKKRRKHKWAGAHLLAPTLTHGSAFSRPVKLAFTSLGRNKAGSGEREYFFLNGHKLTFMEWVL